MTKDEEILNLIEELKSALDEIERVKDFIKSIGQSERYSIAKEIVGKLTTLLSELPKANNLISKYATLRYIFETFVNVRLLNTEATFTFQLYYSIFQTQVDKTEKLLNTINREIELAKKYAQREYQEQGELNKLINTINIQEFQEKSRLLTESIDRDSDFESVIFWGDYKNNGYSFTAHLLEKKAKPEYEKRLEGMRKTLENVKEKVFNNNAISTMFKFQSKDDVFGKLNKRDKWSDKARRAGLQDDYNLIYDLSSSLLHSTAYSLFTNKDLEEADNELIHSMTTRYVTNIVRGIDEYLNLKSLRRIVFVKG